MLHITRRKGSDFCYQFNLCKRSMIKNVLALTTLIPSLAAGLFATPALASTDYYRPAPTIERNIIVYNDNSANVYNAVVVAANTGNNVANGGNGGEGGNGGRGGDGAGNGGNGGNGDDGGRASRAHAGNGGFGGDGATGGATGDGSEGGNGGWGGNGGDIATGDAVATVFITNDVNSNDTDISVEDCVCEPAYNIHVVAVTDYESESESDESRSGHGKRRGNDSSESAREHYFTFSELAVEAVPEQQNIEVTNNNDANVENAVVAELNSGDNVADGGNGSDAGNGGRGGDGAGNGGNGGDGGEGGDASTDNGTDYRHGGKHGTHDGYNGYRGYEGHNGTEGEAGDAGNGGNGSNGGNTGDGARAGDGGDGGEGGVIRTGRADALVDVINVTNRNVSRIRR